MNKTVTILVLCYNEKHFLDTVLGSIKKLSYQGKIQTILIDNASHDGSADYVSKKFPWVKLIRNKKNTGTPGFNVALPLVKGEYVVWVGSDTRFEKNCIKNMVNYLEKNPKVGGLYPKIVDFEGKSLDGWYCFSRTMYFFSTMEKPKNLDYSAIGPGMIKKSVLDSIKYIYDPEYFYSYEDVDLCLRIRLAGYTVEFFPDGILYHRGSINFNSRNKPARLIYLGERNAFITFLKIGSIGTILIYLPYYLLFRAVLVPKDILTMQFSKALARIKGLVWAIPNANRIAKKRAETQKMRKRGDSFVYQIANEKEFVWQAFKKLFGRETFNIQEYHQKHGKKL